MRGGPSGSDCRVRIQTAGSGASPMIGVVSVSEKAGCTRQVRAGKTNVSEPLMTCRKRIRCLRNQVGCGGLGQMRTGPADGSHGDRHGDGVSPVQALVAERGNLPPRCEGRNPSGGPTRMSVPMRGGGADGLVVARMPGNTGGAKEPDCPASGIGQPARGGADV
jgi:hypothetical protein